MCSRKRDEEADKKSQCQDCKDTKLSPDSSPLLLLLSLVVVFVFVFVSVLLLSPFSSVVVVYVIIFTLQIALVLESQLAKDNHFICSPTLAC